VANTFRTCTSVPARPRAGAGLLAGLLVFTAGAGAVAQLPDSRDPARLRAGVFLYASPSMGDTNFSQTIVLLLDHGRGGSMGVVINQPTETSLRKVLPDLPEARRLEVPVYWGGPVQPEGVSVLLRNPRRVEGATQVLPGVYRTTELEVLREALDDQRPDRHVRVYTGYAGWSPGQLEREVRVGAWLLDRGEADAVFARDPESLWERVRDIARRVPAE
jgi:putative transcriptional regulator